MIKVSFVDRIPARVPRCAEQSTITALPKIGLGFSGTDTPVCAPTISSIARDNLLARKSPSRQFRIVAFAISPKACKIVRALRE